MQKPSLRTTLLALSTIGVGIFAKNSPAYQILLLLSMIADVLSYLADYKKGYKESKMPYRGKLVESPQSKIVAGFGIMIAYFILFVMFILLIALLIKTLTQ